MPTLFADFGRPVTIGAVTGVGIPDLKDEAFATSDRPDRGAVVIAVSKITVWTNEFPDCDIGDDVIWQGGSYTVRERLRVGDGALTEILLGSGPLTPPAGEGPSGSVDGGSF
jgi:hypothetical protein